MASGSRMLTPSHGGTTEATKLLFEHRNLLGFLARWPAPTLHPANHGENVQRAERRAGYEDALGIGAGVRRIQQVSVGGELGEIVGHEPLDDVIVLIPESNPESFGAWPRGKCLAAEIVSVAEIADEVDALNLC